MRLAVGIVVMALIVGCASKPPQVSRAKPEPSDIRVHCQTGQSGFRSLMMYTDEGTFVMAWPRFCERLVEVLDMSKVSSSSVKVPEKGRKK